MHARLLAVFLMLSLPAAAQPVGERLDQYLTARANLGQFTGTALIAHEGKILLRKGYGYANLEHLVPNAPETKFEIASLTKSFTAFAIHELAREEKLRLEAPMCTYFEPCPDGWKTITIAQLVHHTSGIPDYEDSLEMGSESYYANLMRDDSAKWAIDWARTRPLDFAPGSQFKYSNTAYLILGFIIERASGRTYEEFLHERAFAPLKLTSTMHIDRTRPQLHRADAYTHRAPLLEAVAGIALTSAHLRRAPALRQESPQADGGLLSTVDDLYTWTRFILGKPELLEPQQPGGYAYGWFVTTRNDRKLIFHTGSLPGMTSIIQMYPESGTTLILLCNFDRARMANIARDLTNIVFGRPYDVPRSHKITTIDAQHAARFTGDYKLADGRLITIRHDAKNGWLEGEVKDEFTAGLLPESELVYYAPMWEGTITFVPASDQTVSELVLRQTGKDVRGRRN